ncbi:unnamed protein product [Alopecurus aequalis]
MPPRAPRGGARKAPATWERDWADLPADTISCILHKLDHVELLLGGVRAVCSSWRRAAREEPELWRRIDLRYLPAVLPFTRRANIMRAALRFSAGQCHTFSGAFTGGLIDDYLFLSLAKQAPSLKRLHLVGYNPISNGVSANAIRNFPLLEELQLVNCFGVEQMLQVVAKWCPCLKHFTLVEEICHYHRIKSNDLKAFAIARMHGLRSLVLVGHDLSNQGLTTIIDNCPHLEYLKIRDCCDINMDSNLTAKCARILIDYYEYFPPPRPCRCCMYSIYWFTDDDDYDYDHNDYHDLFLYSYLGDDIDAADFDEYERILDIKRMRRYLS